MSLSNYVHLLTIPWDGFSPTTPQYEAGRRIEPPVSVPRALWEASKFVTSNTRIARTHYTSQLQLLPRFRLNFLLPTSVLGYAMARTRRVIGKD